MKRISILALSLLTILSIASSSAVAQNLSVGVHGGFINAYTDGGTIGDTSISPRRGLVVGASGVLEIFPSFSFQAGVQYSQKGAEYSVALPGGGRSNGDYRIDYLEIPITLNFDLVSSPRVYVLGGTSLGTVLSAVEEGQGGERDVRDSINTSSVSLELGGGVGFDLSSHVRLLGEARYSYGLSDAAKANRSLLDSESWRARDLKVTLGLYYSLFGRGDD